LLLKINGPQHADHGPAPNIHPNLAIGITRMGTFLGYDFIQSLEKGLVNWRPGVVVGNHQ
jgi:hypothetical protein